MAARYLFPNEFGFEMEGDLYIHALEFFLLFSYFEQFRFSSFELLFRRMSTRAMIVVCVATLATIAAIINLSSSKSSKLLEAIPFEYGAALCSGLLDSFIQMSAPRRRITTRLMRMQSHCPFCRY